MFRSKINHLNQELVLFFETKKIENPEKGPEAGPDCWVDVLHQSQIPRDS